MENPKIKPEIAPFKKLCMSIGAIPTSFQDSMDYYECMLWLIKYLENTIIPVVNNNGEAVAELQDLYITLKNYVENYFENLDVQDEINNKLDTMVEDGSLQEIISEYLNAVAIKFFNTVNDMKNDENLSSGNVIRTLGFYSISDGGSALYIIREPLQNEEPNEIETFALQNNLIAQIIMSENMNAKQFGLSTSNFSSLLNYLLDNYLNIYVPYGEYTITQPINITKNFTKLTIDADISCQLDINFFNITGEYCTINLNGAIIGNSNNFTGTVLNIGCNSKSVGHNIININKVNGVQNGILFSPNNNYGCHYNRISFNYIQAINGIHFKAGDTSSPWINENTFYGGRLLGTTGVLFEKGAEQSDRYNGNKFINIGFELLNCAVDIDFCHYNFFDRCRMNESLQGSYWIKCGTNAINNTFTLESAMKYDKIKDDSTGINNKNTYNVNIYDDGGNWLGNKFYSSEGYFIIPKDNCLQPNRLIINGYNQNGTITHIPVYTEEATLLVGNDATSDMNYILPKEVFNERKIRVINLCVGYKSGGATINIYDSDNNLLVSNTQFGSGSLSRKWYKLEYKYLPYGNWKAWRLEEITSTSP